MVDSSHSQRKIFCINFTRWKQSHIRAFLASAVGVENNLIFITSAKQAIKRGFDSSSQIISWASKDQSEVDSLAKKFNVKPWYVEDGFIRSTGLGTDLTAPASLVLDKSGIYYDPTRPSDLELILQRKKFSPAELLRAGKLIHSLLENELSKYNLGVNFDKTLFKNKPKQKVILIPGQVEGDASIIKGCVDIKTNAELIQTVRKQEPDAYLLYKPHPDVVSGNREGRVSKEVLRHNCDLVLLDASITDCLAVADEVHTMTSLVGFEGLMRALKVVCYGLPFYSGWGLTEDIHSNSGRTRKLRRSELVAATLIDYPLYIDWQTSSLSTPEVIVAQLKQQIENQGGKQSNQVFWLRRLLRKIKNFIMGIYSKKESANVKYK